MKKIINALKKLWYQKYGVIIGLLVGTIITSCISYGVNQIQSSSVSYTRDGKTMSVEEAIDDLIVKVNNKNEHVSVSIDGSGSGTLQLKSTEENVTWESSDNNIATVDSNGLVTAKSTGTVKITVKNDNVSSSVNVTVIGKYLADVVSVGDYVAYDAGSWTETKAQPTSQGQFGGYTKDQNKANSVSECASTWGSTTLKGWRVYSINTNTKTVTLIHAGQPECYYHSNNPTASVINLNNRAMSTYLNNDYADSAHMMNKDENILRTTGVFYWLATAGDSGSLWRAGKDGTFYGQSGGVYVSFGIRPVVVLKSKILTTGKGTDKVGQEAWTLVKP